MATHRSTRRSGSSGRSGSSKSPAKGRARRGRWLVKTEPSDYAYADLEREGRAVWDGIANPLARIHLRAMRAGDPVLVYHTGAERAVVGLAKVARGPYPDPSMVSGAVAVDLEAVRPALTAVPTSALRDDPACADLALVRIPRLSVMPVSERAWAAIARRAGWSGPPRGFPPAAPLEPRKRAGEKGGVQ